MPPARRRMPASTRTIGSPCEGRRRSALREPPEARSSWKKSRDRSSAGSTSPVRRRARPNAPGHRRRARTARYVRRAATIRNFRSHAEASASCRFDWIECQPFREPIFEPALRTLRDEQMSERPYAEEVFLRRGARRDGRVIARGHLAEPLTATHAGLNGRPQLPELPEKFRDRCIVRSPEDVVLRRSRRGVLPRSLRAAIPIVPIEASDVSDVDGCERCSAQPGTSELDANGVRDDHVADAGERPRRDERPRSFELNPSSAAWKASRHPVGEDRPVVSPGHRSAAQHVEIGGHAWLGGRPFQDHTRAPRSCNVAS